MVNGREAALLALRELAKKDILSTKLLNRMESACYPKDRTFFRELVYGVLENRTYLRYALSRISKRPWDTLDIEVAIILFIGAYELHFLRTPDHAGVSEAVMLAEQFAKPSKGFVNALLRNLLRNEDVLFHVDEKDPLKYLSIRYSHPLWMLTIMREEFSFEELEALLIKHNTPAPVSLFLAPGRTDFGEVKRAFADLKPSAVSEYAALLKGGRVTEHPLFTEGKISIQSQPSIRTAQLVVEGLEEKEAEILDLCSAPGSKSIAMALLCPRARIVSNDISSERLLQVRENINRFSLTNVSCTNRDAAMPYEDFYQRFDAVLVDAPCSGLGLLRRKPDIRWKRKEEDILVLKDLQRRILHNAMAYVKPGGKIIYSTCTYGKEENAFTSSMLFASEKFANLPIDGKKAMKYSTLVEDCDGFYITQFRRKDEHAGIKQLYQR